MDEPPSPSGSSAPPEADPDTVSHQQLSSHPLWARARGEAFDRGGGSSRHTAGVRGRGRPGSEHGDPGEARHERISLVAQEQEMLLHADGADSTYSSWNFVPGLFLLFPVLALWYARLKALA